MSKQVLTKTVNGQQYSALGHNTNCRRCVAAKGMRTAALCLQLSDGNGANCRNNGIIWIMNENNQNKSVDSTPTKTMISIASAIQQAGGCVSILKDISLLDFVETCHKNNIRISVTFTPNDTTQ